MLDSSQRCLILRIPRNGRTSSRTHVLSDEARSHNKRGPQRWQYLLPCRHDDIRRKPHNHHIFGVCFSDARILIKTHLGGEAGPRLQGDHGVASERPRGGDGPTGGETCLLLLLLLLLRLLAFLILVVRSAKA